MPPVIRAVAVSTDLYLGPGNRRLKEIARKIYSDKAVSIDLTTDIFQTRMCSRM